MQTFEDFLIYYNNLDVEPFVAAVENMQLFYFERNIDIFKIAISVPGVARRWLYDSAKRAGSSFSLIHRDDEDLYYVIKKNIVGGPSVIFTRDAEVGRTFIKNKKDKPCRNLIGFDSNALYLHCIGMPQPCGGYVRRFAPHFIAEPKLSHEDMFHWMDYIQQVEQITILHDRNHSEIRIGSYLVDGYCPEKKIVFDFYGCWFHGCSICGHDNNVHGKERRIRTKFREKYLSEQKEMVHEIKVIWEHEFKDMLKNLLIPIILNWLILLKNDNLFFTEKTNTIE